MRSLGVKDDANDIATKGDVDAKADASHTHTENVTRVLHNGTAYPTRPSGATYVEWVGPTQPATGVVTGDTWVKTT